MAGSLRWFGKPPHLLTDEEDALLPAAAAHAVFEAEQEEKRMAQMMGGK